MALCYHNADVIGNSERMMVKRCANARLYSFSQVENNMYTLSVNIIVSLIFRSSGVNRVLLSLLSS